MEGIFDAEVVDQAEKEVDVAVVREFAPALVEYYHDQFEEVHLDELFTSLSYVGQVMTWTVIALSTLPPMQIEISLQLYALFPLINRINQFNDAQHVAFQLLRIVVGY